MISRVVLATHNTHKIAEMRELLRVTGWEIVEPAGMESPAETGRTFEANALIKARETAHFMGEWALADDSGLCVDALNGAPGVDTAHYGGWAKLLNVLENNTLRHAQFVCVLALASPQGEEHLFTGTCEGQIAPEGRGSGTFGYDPVFIPAGDTRTFAEMTPDEKHAFSHRGAAVRALLAWWQNHR